MLRPYVVGVRPLVDHYDPMHVIGHHNVATQRDMREVLRDVEPESRNNSPVLTKSHMCCDQLPKRVPIISRPDRDEIDAGARVIEAPQSQRPPLVGDPERHPFDVHEVKVWERQALVDIVLLRAWSFPLQCLQSLRRWSRRAGRSEEHTSELQSLAYLVCRLLLEKKKISISIE